MKSMAEMWSVALLEILTFLWTLSRADVIGDSNTTTVSPFTTLNGTVPSVEGSSSVGAIIGRVAVALCVAGGIGVVLYLMKKKCPRGSSGGEHQPDRRHLNGESRPLNGAVVSDTSRPALSSPPSPQLHKEPRPDSDLCSPEV